MPANIVLSSYLKPVNQVVGTEYELRVSLGLPDYVKNNGGQIHLLFSPMSVYTDGDVTGNTFTQSYSL